MVLMLVPKTKPQQAKQAEHSGRQGTFTTAGSWVSDLAALGKAVMLCDLCVNKWGPEKAGYQRRSIWPGQTWAQGDCDGCGRISRIYLFLPQGQEPFKN